MTPHQSHGRGSYLFDREFSGVGRIRLASGTTDRELFKQMDAMLTALYVQGYHDTLTLLKRRKVKIAVVWNAFRTNRLDKLPTADTMPALGEPPVKRVRGQPRQPGTEGVWLWLESYIKDDRARSNAISNWRNLIEHGKLADPILNDLPVMLRAYRQWCRERDKAAMYNRTKAQVQAYLNDTLGQSHRLYQLVADVKGLKEHVKRPPRPQTPDDMRQLYAEVGPDVGDCCWAMAVTGMIPKEYWGAWENRADRVHIEGRKRKSRVRDVPLIYPLPRPRISRTKFEDDLASVTGGAVSPKDFRNTYGVWLSDAGVPLNRRKHYRGHSPHSMDDLYERVQVKRYLEGDAELLRAYIGRRPETGLRLAK
jgi:hypothetical protein